MRLLYRLGETAALVASLMLPPMATTWALTRSIPEQPKTQFGRVQLSTGLDMHYAERGDPTGQPVILLHGYSDSWFSYSLVLDRLPTTLRVYALDQRGHGKSGQPKSAYAVTDLAADVIAFMDAKGIAKATIVGHSMGGFVAQRVAQTAPQRVSRLVLVATATSAPRFAGFSELKGAIDSFNDSLPAAFAREFQVSTVHAPVPAAFMERVIRDSHAMPLRVWKSLIDGMASETRPAKWPSANIPTLVLRGDRDSYATDELQQELVRVIASATLKTYSNTGHAVHWERPEIFARDLAAFVSNR